MAEEKINRNNENPENQSMDAGNKHLSDALRMSFRVLKVIIIILVIAFLFSGFETIAPGERGLVLRFGKIRGEGKKRILEPGPHWTFPSPIDKVVKISVARKITMHLNSFWYHQKDSEILGEETKRVLPYLNPIRDGYCLARSEEYGIDTANSATNYNIVHSKWVVTYHVDDPERIFKNIRLKEPEPGQSYNDVIRQSVEPLISSIIEDAVVTTMVNYSIEDVINRQYRIAKDVQKLLQKKLNEIESGIRIDTLQMAMEKPWPRQVDNSFLASISASQMREKLIKDAQTYADQVKNEAGGARAWELFRKVQDESLNEEQQDMIWAQFSGKANSILSKAQAYKTRVVENAKANADYFTKILPEYRKRSELVLQKIYQDAIETVLDNVEEKMVIPPTEGTKSKEIRVLINKDPKINQGSRESQKSGNNEQ